ncbi:MAG: DoxX family protein [Bacteroidota bacterium]
MIKSIIERKPDLLPLILRISLGIVFIPKGFELVLNYHDSLDWLTTGALGLPAYFAYAVIVIEFYGALFLVVGLSSRIMAASIGLLVIGTIPYHIFSGLSIDWVGETVGYGLEFQLLIVGIIAVLMITGSGKLSLDHFINRFLCQNQIKECQA